VEVAAVGRAQTQDLCPMAVHMAEVVVDLIVLRLQDCLAVQEQAEL